MTAVVSSQGTLNVKNGIRNFIPNMFYKYEALSLDQTLSPADQKLLYSLNDKLLTDNDPDLLSEKFMLLINANHWNEILFEVLPYLSEDLSDRYSHIPSDLAPLKYVQPHYVQR